MERGVWTQGSETGVGVPIPFRRRGRAASCDGGDNPGMDADPLDNPFWSSLRTRHRGIARVAGEVARYPAEYAPFLGIAHAQGAPGDLMQMMGSTLPFARTRAERERNGDPRPSIEERYATREAYLNHVRAATQSLIAARHVLVEDLDAILERAAKRYDWIYTGR